MSDVKYINNGNDVWVSDFKSSTKLKLDYEAKRAASEQDQLWRMIHTQALYDPILAEMLRDAVNYWRLKYG